MLKHKDKNEIMDAMAKTLSQPNMDLNDGIIKQAKDNKYIPSVIEKLISAADDLDNGGLLKQASQVDYIIESLIKMSK